MKRIALALTLVVLLGAAPTAAQTRVSVSVGFGLPHVSGHVVIGQPYYHSRYYHRRPALVIVERRYYAPPRVVVVPRRHRHHHHHYHWH